MDDETVGGRIARLRMDALVEGVPMTQAQLAAALGLSTQSVSNWERNQNKPGQRVLPRLAKVLGTTPEYLLGGRDLESAEFVDDGDLQAAPPSEFAIGIGQRIREAREAVCMTQKAAGEHLGVTQTAMSYWESGHTIPSVGYLVEMCRIYKAGLVELVMGPGARSPAEVQIAQIREILSGATRSAAAEQSVHATDSQRLVEAAEEAARGKPPRNKAGG